MILRLTALLGCLAASASLAVGQELELREELVDFDRPFGFSEPLQLTAFRAIREGSPLYIFLPNGLALASAPDGGKLLALTYDAPSGQFPSTGQLTGRFEFTDRGEVQRAMDEIRASDPEASFVYPLPANASFGLSGPGMPRTEVTVETSVVPFKQAVSFSSSIPGLTSRVLLAPKSHKLSVIAADYVFDLKGVSRNENGDLIFETRRFTIGTTIDGFCAIDPDQALNVRTMSSGCIHPRYDPRLVREIQSRLIEAGFKSGPIDGVYGRQTEGAIRAFQRSHDLVVDGIPSDGLLEALLTKGSSTR